VTVDRVVEQLHRAPWRRVDKNHANVSSVNPTTSERTTSSHKSSGGDAGEAVKARTISVRSDMATAAPPVVGSATFRFFDAFSI
jgi:hypothetical protein